MPVVPPVTLIATRSFLPWTRPANFRRKGRKDRMVAIGESAVLWVAKYFEDSVLFSPRTKSPETLLFLDDKGSPLAPGIPLGPGQEKGFEGWHREDRRLSPVPPRLCNHMLENGADIRYVQEQLGHASLQTTQVYAQVEPGQAERKTHRADASVRQSRLKSRAA